MSYINTIFPSAINNAFKPAFTEAGDFWNKVILSGNGGYTFTSPINAASFCGVNYAYNTGDKVEGLDIFAVVEPIDGPGSILGSAGPCALVGDYPIFGLMRFDSADAQGLLNQGNFAEVIVHEMGHVIGIGTLWSRFIQNPCPTNTNRPCRTDPFYTGPNGIQGYNDLGGRGNLPIANTGGGGTLNGHWREDFFSNELMTGFLNSGTKNPLSIMTVKALTDIGYRTNNAAAEEYFIPSEFQRPLNTDDIEMFADTLFFEPRDIADIEAEQKLEQEKAAAAEPVPLESETVSFLGLYGLSIVGFLILGMLMYSFQQKQQKRILALIQAQAQQQDSLPSYLPTRK